MKKRIGFDLSILNRTDTGTTVYARKLFQSLQELEQEELEFIPLYAPKKLASKNPFIRPINFLLELSWLFLLLPVRARALHLDLIHLPANTISPVLRKIPQVCTIHDAHFMINPEGRDPVWRFYARRIFRYSAKHAGRIICGSNSARKEAIELLGADPDNIEVVYHGLVLRESAQADREQAAGLKPFILSVGATLPNKNFEALVKAYAKLYREGRTGGHRLILAGPPARGHQSLLETIASEQMEDHVSILGLVSDSLLAALYENASIFAFPSLCEGFGFPPLEAMHYGIPVAASTAPSIPEILGDAPVYFNPRDISEMAENIGMIISDHRLRDKLKQAGLARVKMFSWKESARKTMSIYRCLLGHHSA